MVALRESIITSLTQSVPCLSQPLVQNALG
ncbi:hypothetical protein A2U01_0099620, partial [Trifolium medium]|nr:hypothetical protein [Trifolium medium]